jgi:protein O-mannosyl-transferase
MSRSKKARSGADHRRIAVRPDRTTLIHLLVLSAAGFFLYVRTLWSSFVADDNAEILTDRLIRSFDNIPTFFAHSVWYFLGGQGDRYYRPLKLLAYSTEYHLFHFQSFFWHFTNILANIAVIIAVYLLVRDLASRELGFWAALWFAFHSIHVEAVAWLAGGNDLFCALALVLACWLYHRARSGASPILFQGFAVALFFGALMFKEPALAFPFLLLAYDVFYRRDSVREILRSWQRYLPYFAAAGVYLALRWHALGGFAPDNPKNIVTPKEQFLTVPVLLAQYVWKALLPVNLHFWYAFEPIRAFGWKPLAAFLLALALIASLFWLRRVQPMLSFALAWFLLFLVPVLDIPKLGENVFTERYLYIPSVGFCIFAAWVWLRLLKLASSPLARRAAYAGLTAVFALYCAVIFGRLPVWADDLHLALKTADESPTAKNIAQVGYIYYQQGRLEDSLRYSQRAVTIDPSLAWAHNNIGSAYLDLHRYDQALPEIQKAIELQPDFAPYRTGLANLYKATGQWDRTIEACQSGLAIEPNDHALLTLLAFALWHNGQHEQSLEASRRAIQAEPDRLDAYINLATDLYQLGQPDGAIGQLLAGLEANPEGEEAYLVHYQLGAIYNQKGFSQLAAKEFRRTAELKPGFNPASFSKGASSGSPVAADPVRVHAQ